MRKVAKAAAITAMAILLAGCQTVTGGIGEETLPVETESLQDKTEESESTAESESGAETAAETRTQPGQQESGTAEPPERETKTAATAAKAAEETAGGNGSTGKTDKEASASSANGEETAQEEQQPEETETQARQEPEKSAEPAPQPAPADSPETQPEPEASQEEPEPVQPAPPEQEPVPQPEPEPEPEPEPAPQPEPEPAETQAKTCYDYPFDTGAIRSELIAIGQGAGLTHVEKTPDQSSWAMPVTASENFQGEALKRALADYVSSMPVMVETYGGNPLTEFCIYVENVGNDSYTFYFLY